jgi:hypothetical protein
VNIKYTTLNGLLHGHHFLYDRNGQLLSCSRYQEGKLDGETIHYNIFVKNTDGGTDEFVKIKKKITYIQTAFKMLKDIFKIIQLPITIWSLVIDPVINLYFITHYFVNVISSQVSFSLSYLR